MAAVPRRLGMSSSLGETAGPAALVRGGMGWDGMGGVEPYVSLRSRFGPGPDYLNLGGTAALVKTLTSPRNPI